DHRLAMGTLINELVEKRNEELFLLLDDYHALADDSAVHPALDYFIDHLPATVHVVLASRREPPLSLLAKWRAKRDVAELTREALRFTADEIRGLLGPGATAGISQDELQGLAQQTEGWVTGVQLIVQAALRDGRTVGETLRTYRTAQGDLFRYFALEIFARERPAAREFLRRSAVLETMDPEACRVVLDARDAAARLAELEQGSVFVTVADDGTYRYHNLFREFLYDQLTDPAERRELHGRAAAYFDGKGEPDKAIDHFLRAGQHGQAVRLIGQQRERLINRAQFVLLRSWLDRLPAAAFDEEPWLYALQAALCKEQGKLEQAEALYQKAESRLVDTDTTKPSRAYVLSEKGIILHRKGESRQALETLVQAFACCAARDIDLKISILGFASQVLVEGLGDIRRARAYLDRARALLDQTDNQGQVIYIEQKQAVLLESAGEKRQAFKVYQRIIERIGDNYFHLVGSYFHNAAKIALDLGQTGWAEQCLNHGREVCRDYEDVFSASMLEFGFGYLRLYQGDWDKAQAHLEKARDIFQEMNWTRSVCISLRQLSRLARYRGDYARALRYLDLMKQQPLGPIDQVAAILELALIETARGDYRAAGETLASCWDQACKYFGRMGEIYCCLAKAGIQSGSKRPQDAMRWFGKAVALCRDHGFSGMLACELRASPVLAALAKKCTAERAYLLSLPAYQAAAIAPSPAAGGPQLRIQLFGPPRLLLDDREITGQLRRQASQLFCYLAYHGERGAGRDEILEAMWPGVKPKQAVANFHLVLFEVRGGLKKSVGRTCDKAVVKQGGRYRISGELPLAVDALAYDGLLARSRDAERAGDAAAAKRLLAQAVGMPSGVFGSGWTDEWVQVLSRQYDDRQQKALLKLAVLHFRDGSMDASRECYGMALQRDGLCEEAYRGLIKIAGALGRRGDAQEAFSRLQRTVRQELKTEPAAETVKLYQAVMADGK
ncbi:MAG TPA: BTAD domain-containing putative transcriptional regulator, partial [Candidatus Edwardsbacteria bacterium]|nr:BTAD domain-containing putative transcriptional regulator [Candidatus Edwardsbacteria bacterium]